MLMAVLQMTHGVGQDIAKREAPTECCGSVGECLLLSYDVLVS